MSTHPTAAADQIVCSAGCKRTAILPIDATPPIGWQQLQITGRWRCNECRRALEAASEIPGTLAEYVPDPLPPISIGGLKKLPEPPPMREEVKP